VYTGSRLPTTTTTMLQQFFSDLGTPGCLIQLGSENTILKTLHNPYPGELEQFTKFHAGKNLFFLGGVTDNAKMKFGRAKDDDIALKNYFYIDFDVRKAHPELTDDQIKSETWMQYVKEILNGLGAPYSDWRYVVFTGNGLHIYYFGNPVKVEDKNAWRHGLGAFMTEIETALGESIDRACINPARIARLPGSENCKSKDRKLVEIIDHQDKTIDMDKMLKAGKALSDAAEQDAKSKKSSLENQFPDKGDVYNRIQALPVGRLMCNLMGWQLMDNAKNFVDSTGDRKAPFVSPKGNFIVHGGSPHLPPSNTGYSPFELVKAIKKYDNHQTFLWFRQNYSEIRKLDEEKRQGITTPVTDEYNISDTFAAMRESEIRSLNIGMGWDDWRLIVRKKVTRIGAMPGTGKSKLGYFLTHALLQKEYRGLFFSSETPAEEVLAHLLQIRLEKPALDILEHKVIVPPEIEVDYRNLKVYDVKHMGNSLARVDSIIKKENDIAEAKGLRPVDFIVLDWSQQFSPKTAKGADIYNWAWAWGNDCQEIAQKYDIAFIDVCQLSTKGVKDEDEAFSQVPFEGGNKLHQTADISSLIKRDKSLGAQTDEMEWDVRKSKIMGRRFRLGMSYEWKTGKFNLLNATDSRVSPGETGTTNYVQLRKESSGI
jgi:hypothetical protein